MSTPPEFVPFQKLARFNRNCTITEKIDGTNAQIYITDDGEMYFGSRTRWITPQDDNQGFARWAEGNKAELMNLGPGHHFGEWWGAGIQRRYGLTGNDKRFSLFNTARWNEETPLPVCCSVVPVLYQGVFDTAQIQQVLQDLADAGSKAAPGFMDPEGIVIWHIAYGKGFKVTLKGDGGKWQEGQVGAEAGGT